MVYSADRPLAYIDYSVFLGCTSMVSLSGYTLRQQRARVKARACEGSSPYVHSTCTSYVLCAYLYCVYAIVGGVINPRRACARVTVLVHVLSVCDCLSVCLCVFPILAPRAIRRRNSSIIDFSAIRA